MHLEGVWVDLTGSPRDCVVATHAFFRPIHIPSRPPHTPDPSISPLQTSTPRATHTHCNEGHLLRMVPQELKCRHLVATKKYLPSQYQPPPCTGDARGDAKEGLWRCVCVVSTPLMQGRVCPWGDVARMSGSSTAPPAPLLLPPAFPSSVLPFPLHNPPCKSVFLGHLHCAPTLHKQPCNPFLLASSVCQQRPLCCQQSSQAHSQAAPNVCND